MVRPVDHHPGHSSISIGLAALAWAYAIAWFLVLDQIKVIAYRFLERRGIASGELNESPAAS